jgi:hypothetical protein
MLTSCTEMSQDLSASSQQQTFTGASVQSISELNNSTSSADDFNVSSFLKSAPELNSAINNNLPSSHTNDVSLTSTAIIGSGLQQALVTTTPSLPLLTGSSDYPYGVSGQNGCSSFADLPFMDWVDAATESATNSDSLLPSLVNRYVTTPSTDDKTNTSTASSSTFDDDDFMISEFLNLPQEISRNATSLSSSSSSSSLHGTATYSTSYAATLPSMSTTSSDFDWCNGVSTSGISATSTRSTVVGLAKYHNVIDLFDGDEDMHASLDLDIGLDRMLMVSGGV